LPTDQSPAIVIDRLTKTFGSRIAVSNVSLSIDQGEVFGFLGPNGAGKSTTLRTLLGFMKPTSGSCRVMGHDSHADTIAMHRQVGNLPSEFSLENRMTGFQLISLYASLRGCESALNHASELAERLDADLHRPMRRLSRGNKQKIGLIQALFHQPEVVVLDEPTGGLDPLVQEEFLSIVRECRDRGQTVLFSSHVLNDVERVADRVGMIRDGELVAVERPEVLAGRAWRNLRVQLDAAPDEQDMAELRDLPGVEKLELDGASVSLVVHRDIDTVMRVLGRNRILQLDAERPPLEELFLKYYGHGAPP
jgi:ABC-2 type transport system ATP-binding protein